MNRCKRVPLSASLGVVLVASTLPVPAASQSAAADAPDATKVGLDVGWDRERALLFSLNNVMQRPQFLSAYQGFGLAGQLHLDSDTALRAGVDLSRTSDPQQVTRTTTKLGNDSITTFSVNPATGYLATRFAVDYLMRGSRRAVAPYGGGGLSFDWTRSTEELDDTLTSAAIQTTTDERTDSLTAGLRGILGVTWRIHESFAIFAEYVLSVRFLQWNDYRRSTTATETATGATNRQTTRRETTSFLQLSLGLAQGASFGLVAMF